MLAVGDGIDCVDALTAVLAALADPTRRDLIARLANGDATAGELAAPYAITPQAVSKHLRVLEQAGLVSRRRDAQRRPAHLEVEQLDLLTMWIERQRRNAAFRPTDDPLTPPTSTEESVSEPHSARIASGTDSSAERATGGGERVFQAWDLEARRVVDHGRE